MPNEILTDMTNSFDWYGKMFDWYEKKLTDMKKTVDWYGKNHISQTFLTDMVLTTPDANQYQCYLLMPNIKQHDPTLLVEDKGTTSTLFIHTLLHSFIFPSAIMRKLIQTSCSNSPVFIRSSSSIKSIYLLYIALSSAPASIAHLYSKINTPYSHLHLIYSHLLLLN